MNDDDEPMMAAWYCLNTVLAVLIVAILVGAGLVIWLSFR